jgi:hypothetical protein
MAEEQQSKEKLGEKLCWKGNSKEINTKEIMSQLRIAQNYILRWSLNCNYVVKHDMIATVTSKTMMSHLDRGF